jgi:hypothetical protein
MEITPGSSSGTGRGIRSAPAVVASQQSRRGVNLFIWQGVIIYHGQGVSIHRVIIHHGRAPTHHLVPLKQG